MKSTREGAFTLYVLGTILGTEFYKIPLFSCFKFIEIVLNVAKYSRNNTKIGVFTPIFACGGDNWDRTSDLMHVKHAL